MDFHAIIVNWVFGAVLLSAINQTALFLFTKNKLVAKYCVFLWSCNAFSALLVIFHKTGLQNFNSVQSILLDFVFHACIISYLLFIFSAFNITKKINTKLWYIFTLELIFLVLHALFVALLRWNNYSETSLQFIIPTAIANVYNLFFVSLSLVYAIRLVKSKFLTLIIVGAVINVIFAFISAYFNVLKGSSNPAFGYLIYVIGIFIDVAIFSIAMGFKFKESIDERLLAVSKASEYQLAMLNGEIHREREISLNIELERKRLSQVLHDDIANSVFYIKTQVETELLKTKDISLKNRLQNISEHVSIVYRKTRDKSHQWFLQTQEESETSFQIKVRTLIADRLSDERYQIDVVIDDDSLQAVSIEIKGEILNIIQEAIINISKHALATKVQVIIYKDIPKLIVEITDNGKGFDIKQHQKGIGLLLLNNRVANLKGETNIQSNNSGTLIRLMIPL